MKKFERNPYINLMKKVAGGAPQLFKGRLTIEVCTETKVITEPVNIVCLKTVLGGTTRIVVMHAGRPIPENLLTFILKNGRILYESSGLRYICRKEKRGDNAF